MLLMDRPIILSSQEAEFITLRAKISVIFWAGTLKWETAQMHLGVSDTLIKNGLDKQETEKESEESQRTT